MHVIYIPFNYKYILHTHSHIALLGWVYSALTIILYKIYLKGHVNPAQYKRIFLLTQISLIGMLCSFPFQGYALFSIIFSTLFLFASYWFSWFLIQHTPIEHRNSHSFRCIKAALWYLIISSAGPWALGVIMNTLGSESVWYKTAIYFYLHFFYNGWVILALTGLFLYVLEEYGLAPTRKEFRPFFRLVNVSIVLTFFLSILWPAQPGIFRLAAIAGAIVQLVAFGFFAGFFIGKWKMLRTKLRKFTSFLFILCGVALIVKLSLQSLTAIPYFAGLVIQIVDFVIGYLHWTFLGLITVSLFALLSHFQLLKLSVTAFSIYLAGFILSETLIFYKGTIIWLGGALIDNYFFALVIVSAFIPLGIYFIFIKNLSLSVPETEKMSKVTD